MRGKLLIPEYDFSSIYPNKKCLSSSQALCYEKDPAKFYTEYELGVREKPSIPMLIGLIFSELHRDRSFDFRTALKQAGAPNKVADFMAAAIVKLPVVPAEIALVAKFKGWYFRATLDGFLEKFCIIVENKTGKTEWTQERANFDDQMTFQSWVHWKKYGVPPKKVILNWLNMKNGAVKSYKTSRSMKNLKMFDRRMELVIAGIEAKNFTKNLY